MASILLPKQPKDEEKEGKSVLDQWKSAIFDDTPRSSYTGIGSDLPLEDLQSPPRSGGGEVVDEELKSPRRRKGYIPYSSIYESLTEARRHSYWIPGIALDATIVAVEKDTESSIHLLNPYLYTIELQHGRYKWRVRKRYQDFSHLYQRILAHSAAVSIKSRIRRARDRLEDAMEVMLDTDGGAEDKQPTAAGGSAEEPWHHHLAGRLLHSMKGHGEDHEEMQRVELMVRSKEMCELAEEEARRREEEELAAANEALEGPLDGTPTSGGGGTRTKRGVKGLGEKAGDDLLEKPSPDEGDDQHQQRRNQQQWGTAFPMVPDSMLSEERTEERRQKLESWLQDALSHPISRDYHETAEFLEVSRFSFINELGGKYREGEMKKRPGGNRVYIGCKQCCVRWFLPWMKRWLVLKDSYVCYMNPRTEHMRFVLLFDEQFEINSPLYATPNRPRELILSNLAHVMHMKCKREEDALYWTEAIRQVLDTSGKVWLEPKPHGSSFPPRPASYCQWFVDTKDFWDKASAMLEMAREEIYIADWWLCPEIFLRRPIAEGNHWRLDEVLKRQAEKGVRIFVLIYKEMEMAIGLNSTYTKKHLQALHPNIRVMRHPDHTVGTGTWFWAHHEKLLIIDQLIAFVGGIDLCYGRWDDWQHRLTDLGSVQFVPKSEQVVVETEGKCPLVVGLPERPKEEVGAGDDVAVVHRVVEEIREDGKPVGTKVTSTIKRRSLASEDGKEEEEPKNHQLWTAPDAAKEHGLQPGRILCREEDGDESLPISPTITTPQTESAKTAKSKASKKEKTNKKEVESGGDAIGDGGRGGSAPSSRRRTNVMRSAVERLQRVNNRARSQPPPASSSSSQAKAPTAGAEGIEEVEILDATHRAARPSSLFGPGQSSSRRPQAVRFRNFRTLGEHLRLAGRRKTGVDGDSSLPTTPAHITSQQAVDVAAATANSAVETPQVKRNLMQRVVEGLRGDKETKAKRRWRMAMDQEDAAREYVINYIKVKETTVDMSGLMGAGKLWPGKDYVNFIVKDVINVQEAYNDFINRYETPRMPWHDIHALVYGAAARDVARHFIQRWNAVKTEKAKLNSSYPYLLPKSYNSVKIPRFFLSRDTHRVEVQVLRSAAHWSTLMDRCEASIQQAYLHLIANAEHYIYIENQFFVSMVRAVDVQNEISRVLVERIVRAHKNKETFRVYVTLPLLPAFEGDIGPTSYSALLAVLHWTYMSISRGPYSLLECLKAAGVENWRPYLTFCSLRTYGELCGRLVTELIYIHSKLMIVDDKWTIIGSANINDRSQSGNRDSEVCLLIKDEEFVPSKMNGADYQAGRYALTLRRHLMQEHLGMLGNDVGSGSDNNAASSNSKENTTTTSDGNEKTTIDVQDPVIDSFFTGVWKQVAESNSRTYEEVFRAYPTNSVETFEELLAWRGELPLAYEHKDEAMEKLGKDLVGRLVEFPLNFLRRENLSPTITSKEGLVPSVIFT